jgi:hypothetical protein
MAPTAVTGAFIGEQAAIDAALKFVTMGDGHLSPAQEPPKNIHAELGSRDKAKVWIITMDGTWTVNGPPRPTPTGGITPSPLAPLHHLVLVVDASTGVVRSVEGRP